VRARIVALAVACTLLVSCGGLWNLANRSALAADVAEVMDEADDPDLQCAMIGVTRAGYCLLPASEGAVSGWATSLGLASGTASLDRPETVPPLAAEGAVGCLDAQVFVEVDGLPAYWLGGRPSQLSLSNGGQFEYMLLLYDPETGRACVQVSYAYG
jgi:hypothetical protein